MKRIVLVLSIIVLAITVKGYSQQAPASAPGGNTVTAEEQKVITDMFGQFKLTSLQLAQARRTASESDPVAKGAMELYNQAVDSSPDVKKAHDANDIDRKKIIARLEELKKKYNLTPPSEWDFDFALNKFVKINVPPSQPPAVVPAAPAPAPAKKPAKG